MPRGGETPHVSVVIPVRNEANWIQRSLSSLADQSYGDFEVVLIDDGCTDNTIALAQGAGVPNLRVVRGPCLGLARALQLGVMEARGEIIVRQDADDFSFPDRIRRQVEYLAANPRCVVVGTWAAAYDEKGERLGIVKTPTRDAGIRLRLTLETSFVHVSVAVRRRALLACGGYTGQDGHAFPEDYDLWSRLQDEGTMANIPEVLVGITSRGAGITRSSWREIGQHAGRIAARNMASFTGADGFQKRLPSLLSRFYLPGERLRLLDAMYLEMVLLRARLRAGLFRGRGGYRMIYFLKPIVWCLRAGERGSAVAR